MAVSDAMFLFEVVLESVKSLVDSNNLVVRADFADVFSLDLKDPKLLNVEIPQPPPEPPKPPGKKKGKKRAPKKRKKSKKGKAPPPPPEPVIQSGQSVLFASSAEVLIANMKKDPMILSLWSKEEELNFIGSANVSWDFRYVEFLEVVGKCQKPKPITVKGEYNIFNENTAKLMAKVTIQIKLSYLEDKMTSQFRTVASPIPGITKFMYTGVNSKDTSYMCCVKFSNTIPEIPGEEEDAEMEESIQTNHMETTYVREKPIQYADYKNARGTNPTIFDDENYCCITKADKPPPSIHHRPPVVPDLDFLSEYVADVIRSCNNAMRTLTPCPQIKPRVKASDIDRACGCNREWPKSNLADMMKCHPAYRTVCAMCSDPPKPDPNPHTIEIHNIRGPCGETQCKVAEQIRNYIEQQAQEENKDVDLDTIVGPCGSTKCTLSNVIRKFIRKEGLFQSGATEEGLPSVCACDNKLKESMKSCEPVCDYACDEEDASICSGEGCPYNTMSNEYVVNYCLTSFADEDPKESTVESPCESKTAICRDDCPNKVVEQCSSHTTSKPSVTFVTCSPHADCSETCGAPDAIPDDDIVINLDQIGPSCGLESCTVADELKGFIYDVLKSPKKDLGENPCFCDCECRFDFDKKTTYCGVCGGYEVAGTDFTDYAPYGMPPPPCPIYHNLYDKNKFKISTESTAVKKDEVSVKGSKIKTSDAGGADIKSLNLAQTKAVDKTGSADKKSEKKSSESNVCGQPKKVGKFTFNYGYTAPRIGHSKCLLSCGVNDIPKIPNVPRNMGWLWTSEDVPGMKYRPDWRPGAVSKRVFALLRLHKDPEILLQKKKLKEKLKNKSKTKNEQKPLLIVHKKDGEYTVTMETMKTYPKGRQSNQYPYEDKPPETFCIGRSAEENDKRDKRNERKERRLEREKRRYIKGSFKNKCNEMCEVDFKEATGIIDDDENEGPDLISVDDVWSCTCSESSSSGGSESDKDEWIVEFTPPYAKYDPKQIAETPKVDNSSQYSYLDFRVKKIGKDGQLVPRFFIGPDGKAKCSDLGGFKAPTAKESAGQYNEEWLEINIDGWIALADTRWVPNTFYAPDGQEISSGEGQFIDPDGNLCVIGEHGYVDVEKKWTYVPHGRSFSNGAGLDSNDAGPYSNDAGPHSNDGKPYSNEVRSYSIGACKPQVESEWSCFDSVPIELLAEKNIVGHSRDKKLMIERIQKLQSQGMDIKLPTASTVPLSSNRPHTPHKKRIKRFKCRHKKPSRKGVISVDAKGNKTYFSTPDWTVKSSVHAIQSLEDQGKRVLDDHIACFDSFMGCKTIKKMHEQQILEAKNRKFSRHARHYPSEVDHTSGMGDMPKRKHQRFAV